MPAATAFVCFISACVDSPVTPIRFARGEKIRMGELTLSITDVESIAPFYIHEDISFAGPTAGEMYLAVYVTWDRTDDLKAAGQRSMSFMKSWILGRFSLQDATGQVYRVLVPMDTHKFRTAKAERMGDERPAWDPSIRGGEDLALEWTVLFKVPDTARGFTLLLNNLDRIEGQPRMAAIPLGR